MNYHKPFILDPLINVTSFISYIVQFTLEDQLSSTPESLCKVEIISLHTLEETGDTVLLPWKITLWKTRNQNLNELLTEYEMSELINI